MRPSCKHSIDWLVFKATLAIFTLYRDMNKFYKLIYHIFVDNIATILPCDKTLSFV